ncbi:MAG: MBL fold metallo-hydrolase [Moorellales bacterium]
MTAPPACVTLGAVIAVRWLRISLPTPFPVGPVNVYLLPGDPLTLIDAGPYLEEAWQTLREALRAQGFRVGSLRRILLTHSHPDHSGLARRLQEESGAEVYLHPREHQKLGIEYREEPPWLLACGIPPELIQEAARSREWDSRFLQPLPAVRPLGEGDQIPGDGYCLRVLHTPGHSSGHLCFYDPNPGLMWCGDTLLEHITPNPMVEPCRAEANGRTPSLSLYLSTLNRLADLEVRQALPGHGAAITSPRERIRQMLAHHRQRSEEILAILRGAGRPLTPWQVALKLYSGLEGENIFLAASEVVAHLDALAKRGLVREVGSEHTVYFSSAPRSGAFS